MASEIIQIENFPASNVKEVTKITADASAGQAIVVVENTDNIAVDDYVILGVVGGESAQLAQIDVISGLSITLDANLNLKHFDNEPFTIIKANQAKIYRATNADGTVPADASFSSLVATVSLQADQLYTEVTDTTGGSGYWWKYIFYNSTAVSSTNLSEALGFRGAGYGLYANTVDVRAEAGLNNNKWVSDQTIYGKLVKAQSEVNASLLIGGYTLPLSSPYPEVVSHAVILLAAGYLLTMDYGPEHNGTNKDGTLKIKQARDILAKLESGDTPLIDGAGGVSVTQTSKVRGYPDETAENATPSEARMFSITDRY